MVCIPRDFATLKFLNERGSEFQGINKGVRDVGVGQVGVE